MLATSAAAPIDLQDDIQYINEQLFPLLKSVHGENLLRPMGISAGVARRIGKAGPRGKRTAIRCGVPLVAFNEHVKELVLTDPQEWHSDSGVEVPRSFGAFTRFVLQFALHVVHVDRTIAQIFFGFEPHVCEAYGRFSHRRLIALSQRRDVLLRLRGGERPQDWDRLLIGDHVIEPLALEISHQMALLMLAAD